MIMQSASLASSVALAWPISIVRKDDADPDEGIMLAISCASVSLTLPAGASGGALPPQAEKQQDGTEKQGGPKRKRKKWFSRNSMPAFRTRSPYQGRNTLSRTGEGFPAGPKTDLDESRASPIFGCAMAGADKWHYRRAYGDGPRVQQAPVTKSKHDQPLQQSLKRKCIHAHRWRGRDVAVEPRQPQRSLARDGTSCR